MDLSYFIRVHSFEGSSRAMLVTNLKISTAGSSRQALEANFEIIIDIERSIGIQFAPAATYYCIATAKRSGPNRK